MATHMSTHLAEGQCSTRPPLFIGTNYSYWQECMKIYIQDIDLKLWTIILRKPPTPMINIDGINIPKLELDWNVYEMQMGELNARAMNLLYYALDPNEFNQISTCTSTKKIWDKLEITHEGTTQVKNSKINMLMHDYEMFKMEPHESISKYF